VKLSYNFIYFPTLTNYIMERKQIVVLIKFDNVIAKVDECVISTFDQQYQPKRRV
jgi:hypothetical protein